MDLEYQQELEPVGPQNIEQGAIKINDVRITPKDNYGFSQFSNNAFAEMLKKHDFDDDKSINHVFIGGIDDGGFKCSSAEVVNGVFDQIGQCVANDQQGL